MSDFAIYNKVLSANEVKQIYNAREPFNHKEGRNASNLINWWRMGDPTGTGAYPTISDAKGSMNMTMTNMTDTDINTNVP